MPIDSICFGCGQTLRVNDEFVSRKAKCPMCGFIYVAGGDPANESVSSESKTSDTLGDPFGATATFPIKAKQDPSLQPILAPIADSWASTPTKESEIKANDLPPFAAPIPKQVLASADFTERGPVTAGPSTIAVPATRYFVRTPNSMVYGPSDTTTVLDWINQGRLDDSCHIREEASEQWLGIAAWRFQSRSLQNVLVSSNPSSFNQFGTVPQSAVQSAGYGKSGNGVLVLVLGIASWILCVTAFGAWACSILAIVFGVGELKKIRSGESPSKEKSLVLVGISLGVANLAAWLVLLIGVMILAIVNA